MNGVVAPLEDDYVVLVADHERPCQCRFESCSYVAVYRIFYTTCSCGSPVVDLCLKHTEHTRDFEKVFGILECPTCGDSVNIIRIISLRKAS